MSTSAVRPIPKLFELFGRPVYDHWKERKIERKGKTIQPTLKFEDLTRTKRKTTMTHIYVSDDVSLGKQERREEPIQLVQKE